MERQEQALARWLAEHPDYALQEALVDAGVSAGRGRNRRTGALARFIEGGRTGAVPKGSCLVVESMSRFSREIATTTLRTLLNDVWGAGLAISFCTDGVVLDEELIAREDHRLHAILGAIGQARREWEERSRRAKGAAAKARRLQDEGQRTDGRAPWWIERDEEGRLARGPDGSLQLDEEHARAIRRAVELAIAGMGMELIARQLSLEGFSPPPTTWAKNQHRGRGERSWTAGIVSRTLAHPSLTGALVRRDATIPGYYPALLTEAEHHQLRASVEQRDRMKGKLRGLSLECRNLFQGVLRCATCLGPMGYSAPAKRARAGHPGYIACRASRRGLGACSNTGAMEYGEVESHCLTRLAMTDWEALLRQPEDDADRAELEQQVAQLQSERDALQARMERAKRRAEEMFERGDDEAQATAERTIRKLRAQLAQVGEQLGEAEQRLTVIRSRPSAMEAAAELTGRVKAFWDALPTAAPAERLAFCRWLLAQGIEFRIHPKQIGGGDRLVSMLVEGKLVGMAPLAGRARQLAREQGVVDPAAAVQERLPDGSTVVVLRAKEQQQGEGEASPAPQPDPAPTATRLIDDGDGGVLIVQDPV